MVAGTRLNVTLYVHCPYYYHLEHNHHGDVMLLICFLFAFFWVISRRQTPGNYPEEGTQHSEHGEV
jgi:hypothetical protein